MALAAKPRSSRRLLALAAVPALLCALIFMARAARAETPADLWSACPTGAGAGRCTIPRGVAADPGVPGHVYVADQDNARVDEFTAWGQFVRAWGWGVADGHNELETCGPPEPQTSPAPGLCQAGIEGGGAGQFGGASPQGIAVDSEGDVFVVDFTNNRVEKFDPEGHFLLMWGKGVNKGTGEPDRCTAAGPPSDVCGAGEEGSGAGQFNQWTAPGSYIAIHPGATPAQDVVYVGDKERIQEFDADGHYLGELKGGALAGQRIQSLATGPEGNLYVALEESEITSKANALKLEASAAPAVKVVGECVTRGPRAIATEPGGQVLVANGFIGGSPTKSHRELLRFDAGCGGKEVLFDEKALGEKGYSVPPAASPGTSASGIAAGAACFAPGSGRADIYLPNPDFAKSFLRAFGPAPDRLDSEGNAACPAPKAAPSIDQQYTVSAGAEAAAVRAKINPRFWPDATYYVEYGTGECASGGCPLKASFPGAPLIAAIIGNDVSTASVSLPGLSPATTYHYRFVAVSSGGGPVYGIDPDGIGPKEASPEEGLEGTFRTFAASGGSEACPDNEAFRTGPSAALPDCRAYEMVSPVEKENGDIVVPININGNPASLLRAANSGEKLAYSSYRAFGDAQGGPYSSQYIATRGTGGWSSQAISPPRGTLLVGVGFAADTEYKTFADDLCQAWLALDYETEPTLDPGAPAGYPDLYRRQNCAPGAGAYEALNTTVPPHSPAQGFEALEVEGTSADGTEAIFLAPDNLSAEAPANLDHHLQLYERSPGGLRFVCILPGGEPYEKACAAGTKSNEGPGLARKSSLAHAISEDGERVFWSASDSGPGALYVREHPEQGIVSNECSEAAKACTIQISSEAAQFWTASASGSRAIFTVGEKLYEFDVDAKAKTQIAEGVVGLLGWSDDAARLYFASTKVLTGEEGNGYGEKAIAGKDNLYFREAGAAPRFLGVLATGDVDSALRSIAITSIPRRRAARVSPNGLAAAFASSAPLSGYDNADADTGEADAEVFLYQANASGGAGRLVCASCNPSGARPHGVNIGGNTNKLFAAATIPTWESQLYGSRALSDDGKRLFFEAADALSPRDTNGHTDVYEWEAPGEGGCSAASPVYSPQNEGCVYLISSGLSSGDSNFADASPGGRDVFFTTVSSLLPQDSGLVDVYDARALGGFAPPPSPRAECEGQACQNTPAPPAYPTPSSSQLQGPGNVAEGGLAKKHKKKHAKRTKKHKRKSHRPRRASR